MRAFHEFENTSKGTTAILNRAGEHTLGSIRRRYGVFLWTNSRLFVTLAKADRPNTNAEGDSQASIIWYPTYI